MLALLLAGAATALVWRHAENRLHAERQVFARVAESKARAIEHWLEDRAAVALSLRGDRFLRSAADERLRLGDAPLRDALAQRIDELRAALGLAAVLVVDPGSVPLAASGAERPLGDEFSRRIMLAVRTEQPILHLLQREGRSPPTLDSVIPWRAPDGIALIGALVLRADPRKPPFARLFDWPLESRSAEVLLLRSDGEDIALRGRSDAADAKRRPLVQPGPGSSLHEALSRGEPGYIRASDRRGMEVIAYARRIAGTDWTFLVAEDAAESLARVRGSVLSVAAILSGFIALGGLLAAAWIRSRAGR